MMKRSILAAGISLVLAGSAAHAASAMQSFQAECRDEAVSTGLEQDADIQAYVEQCLQRFAGMAGYEEPAATAEYDEPAVSYEAAEPTAEESMVESETAY